MREIEKFDWYLFCETCNARISHFHVVHNSKSRSYTSMRHIECGGRVTTKNLGQEGE